MAAMEANAPAPVNNGCLLPLGTTALPHHLSYAYVADQGNGVPLVASGFRYRQKVEPFAPKKSEGSWRSPPLPPGWSCNSNSLLYGEKIASGMTVATSQSRPPPSLKVASRTLNDLQRLRREHELICLNLPGKGDSDSYLAYSEVLARDKEFNGMWDFSEERRWLAVAKDPVVVRADDVQAVPFGLDYWEFMDALKTQAASVGATAETPVNYLDREKYWEMMGGSVLTSASSIPPVIDATGNHMAVDAWYGDVYRNQLSDGKEIVKFCCDQELSALGNLEATTGCFQEVECSADAATALCMGFLVGGNAKKLDKNSSIQGKFFKAEVRSLMSSRVQDGDFNMHVAGFAEGTPETLKFGLRYIAEQAASFRPKKKRKAGTPGFAKALSSKLFAMIPEETFKTKFGSLEDKQSCIEEGAALLCDCDLASELAEELDGNWTAETQKEYGELVYSRLEEKLG